MNTNGQSIRDEHQTILTALQNCSIALNFSFASLCASTVVLAFLVQWHHTSYPHLLRRKQGSSPSASRPTSKTSQRRANNSSTYIYSCFGHVWKHLQWGADLLRVLCLKNVLKKYEGLCFSITCCWEMLLLNKFFPVDLKTNTCNLNIQILKNKIPWEIWISFVYLWYLTTQKISKRVLFLTSHPLPCLSRYLLPPKTL